VPFEGARTTLLVHFGARETIFGEHSLGSRPGPLNWRPFGAEVFDEQSKSAGVPFGWVF